MAITQKKSELPDAVRGDNKFVLADEGGRALTKAAETWVVATTECQREMIGFISKRLEKDGETSREMSGCKKLSDVTAVQSRWLEETFRDYTSEMTKMLTILATSGERGPRSGGS